MPYYENIFIARQDVTSAQVEGLAEHFTGIVSAQGGNVTKKEFWGLKSLSFRIKKNRKGHYVLMNIDGPAAAVLEMERNMRIHEDVLRHLTVRVDALEEGPSAMLQSRGRDREGREGGFGRRDRGFGGDRDRGDRPDRGERDDRLRPVRENKPTESEGDQV
ncbi:30S ribosomal protein S6 [Dongia deserti]|uniref:30S ribosomal protein S6 n=1 Tax=Dongia deserti TaxID=2268030 RepID=UPI000E654913|nr:30S ribosomal protein S6 [Dongia deserti]